MHAAVKQPFTQSHVAMGQTKHVTRSSGHHWIHTLSLLAPLVIGELVKNPEKRWRYIRLASVGSASFGRGVGVSVRGFGQQLYRYSALRIKRSLQPFLILHTLCNRCAAMFYDNLHQLGLEGLARKPESF
jgi:hypothetical protein